MAFNRSSGMILPVFSLPGPFGIGCFGREAVHFAELLKKSQCKYWQVLPFCPADGCHSPYKSDSAFAGNPMFIDLADLRDRGLLTDEELDGCRIDSPWQIDYDRVWRDRDRVFPLAFSRMDSSLKADILAWRDKHAWSGHYALYKALQEKYASEWYEWPTPVRNLEKEALAQAEEELSEQILYHLFLQYLFFDQWKKIKKEINDLGVDIIGDMPIYVSLESEDAWWNQDLFELKNGKPVRVAGVPPDFFSETGQFWGNPLYDWSRMEKDGYTWWLKRIGHAFELYDVLRIDHFRAFASYYAIPADAKDASTGVWEKGPGMRFFDAVFDRFPDAPIIAEDLGGETDKGVAALRDETGLPGMRVLEMGFITMGKNPHLPFSYIENSVAYLGTHDNNTLLGWLHEDLTEGQRGYALQYANYAEKEDDWQEYGPNSGVTHAFMRCIWQTSASLVMILVQDALGYGSDARINMPGKAEGNWRVRMPLDALDSMNTEWIKFFNMTYQRGME